MSSDGDRGKDTNANGSGKGESMSSSGPRVVVRTTDSAGASMSMAAADTVIRAASEPSPSVADTALSPPGHLDTAVTTSNVSEDVRKMVTDDGDDDSKKTDALIGEILGGRYEITRQIGRGGMGAVYEAKHKGIGKRVAVKVLLDKYAHRDQVVARLEREAQLASSIGHEHIIDITDIGSTHDGRTFVVMEFLEGQSLGAVIEDGVLPEQRAIRIAYQIASALHAAHEKGILHRDIKPDNVFLLERNGKDFVKVVDFGISKLLSPAEDGSHSPRLTQTGMVLGTPLYMSPEQARGADELDHRIDVWSLGVILFEMVTGRVPFDGTNYLSIVSRVANDDIQRPSEIRPGLSRDLESVILRALEKDPANRYQSCEEVADDLALLIEDPGRTTTRGRVAAAKHRRRRERRSGLRLLGWTAGITVTISAVVVTVVVLMSGAKSGDEQESPVTPVTVERIDAGPIVKPPDAAPPRVLKAKIRFESDPIGAEVFWGSRSLGITPFDDISTFTRKDRAIPLFAVLEGYDDAEFEFNPYTDDINGGGKPVSFKLKKTKKGAKPKKVKRPVKDENKPKVDTPAPKYDTPEGLERNPFVDAGAGG